MRVSAGGHRVPVLRELLDHLRAELRKIIGLAAGDQPVIGVYRLVDPGTAGVADVGPQARPGRHRTTTQRVRFDQRPRSVADRPDRLARVQEGPDALRGRTVTSWP